MLKNRNLVSVADIDVRGIGEFFNRVRELKKYCKERINLPYFARRGDEQLRGVEGRVVASLFYEASTRTRLSFESAVQHLGGSVTGTENASQFSSVIKGESLEDTIQTIGHYCDCIVLRHNECGAARRAARVSSVPIINAGDGSGEHPTQALLDLYTIWEQFQDRNDLSLTVVGDLKNGRTVHSLLKLVARLQTSNCGLIQQVTAIAPPELSLPEHLIEEIKEAGIHFGSPEIWMPSFITCSNVIYMTRTQSERGSTMRHSHRYALTQERANAIGRDSIIMHPLPRNEELPASIDEMPQAVYLREQVPNGLYVRMALLQQILQ